MIPMRNKKATIRSTTIPMRKDWRIHSTMHDASEGQVGDLRKGPWTREEDAKLRKLVRKHGARNWRKLGHALNRCGKSCRLRWHSHLKPDIISVRQVPFTRQEDK
ncbi:unnamed protein product [Rhodiola kirilowii]